MILLRVLKTQKRYSNNDMLGRGAMHKCAACREVILQQIVKKREMVKKLSQCLADSASTRFFCFLICDKFNYRHYASMRAIEILAEEIFLTIHRKFKQHLFNRHKFASNC